MGSDNPGGDMTVAGYWGQLKAWGYGSRARVTPRTFTMVGMQGEVINVPCPDAMSPSERQAALQLIASIHLGIAH